MTQLTWKLSGKRQGLLPSMNCAEFYDPDFGLIPIDHRRINKSMRLERGQGQVRVISLYSKPSVYFGFLRKQSGRRPNRTDVFHKEPPGKFMYTEFPQ